MKSDIDALPNDNPKKGVLKRFIGSESVQVTLDKAGRICLPEEMARAAGVKDEAVLVGCSTGSRFGTRPLRKRQGRADAVLASEAFKLME